MTAPAIRGLQALYEWGAMGSWSDGQLVARFLGGDESGEDAFRVLIHRHGPMVLSVCRRVLGDEHAAEDAFQLTFLIFVKKAGTLRDRSLLSNWLHGVALRVARKARGQDARRQSVERRAAESAADPRRDSDEIELRLVIDEEIRRLPERYRLPLVLCHVEGLRHDEVAHRLGCPIGTVESRLSRARQQLRARLTRRGLSPTASVMAAVLRPSAEGPVSPSLAEATLRAAVKVSASKSSSKLSILSALSWTGQSPVVLQSSHVGAIASVAILVVGVAVMTVAFYGRAAGKPTGIDNADASQRNAAVPIDQRKAAIAASTKTPQDVTTSSIDKADSRIERKPNEPIRTTRFPNAIARPLAGITIDGRLDEWPSDLPRYAIRNQLLDHPGYDTKELLEDANSSPYFMAGYDQKASLLYLAVVVHDDDIVVHSDDPRATDAVEIYVDGSFSKKRIPAPDGDWRESLDARTMPVLQYAGVPGRGAAYGDRWGANPSLVYARRKESRTKMQFQRTGDVITYEWAVAVFDSFPGKPSELLPGKKVGLDIAVLDKDRKKPQSAARPPSFRTWGAPPVEFKGCDSGSLGELTLEWASAP
jgi:RNA polymerase sigma factor (sigma-70 family)